MKRAMMVCGFFTVFLLVSMSVRAQTAPPQLPTYQLRTLTVDTILYEVLPIVRFLGGSLTQQQSVEVVRALEAEFLARYGDTATFDQLTRAVTYLAEPIAGSQYPGCCGPAIGVNAWMARVTQRWLLENPTHFEEGNTLGLYPFRITPEPYDFNGNGKPGWILDIEWLEGEDQTERYRNYLTAVQVGDTYHIYPVPVVYIEPLVGQSRTNNGLRDINDDGAVDWLFTIDEPAPGWGMGSTQTYYLVTWNGDHMERLYVGNGRPMNIDDDPALEFVVTYDRSDNWMCGHSVLQIYDWDETAYTRIDDRITEGNDCTARHAEEAMWAGDFAAAADLYTAYIHAQVDQVREYAACRWNDGGYCSSFLAIEIYRYFIGRRILAYALMGDTAHVEALLQETSANPEAEEWVRSGFVQALLDANAVDAEALCYAAYTYFAESFRGTFNVYGESIAFLPGKVAAGVNDGSDPLRGYRADPARAGCDISRFNGTPTPTPIPTSPPTFPPSIPNTPSQTEHQVDLRDYADLFMIGDYGTILDMSSDVIAGDEDFQKVLYWRALTLEVSGQTQAALDTYVTLYTYAPGTWWGWLAGMHLSTND